MANPAELLHATLNRWRSEYPKSHAPAPEQRIAVRHLDAIAELLNQMDDAGARTDLYRKHFGRWEVLTLHHPHGWQGANTSHRDNYSLENLEILGDRLNGLVLHLQGDGVEAILSYCTEVRELLDSDDTIKDVQLRRHLKQVIGHLEWCAKNFKDVGEFDLQEAIERLVASMVRATAASSRRDRWKEKLNTVVWPFTVGVATELAASNAQLAIAAAFGG